jgi:hypothetical protein
MKIISMRAQNEYAHLESDARLFDCLDLALCTLGQQEKEFVIYALESRYHISRKNISADPDKLVTILEGLLGPFASASVIIYFVENIKREFGLSFEGKPSLVQTFELALRSRS